ESSPPADAPPIDRNAVNEVLRTRRASETRTVAGGEPLVSFIFPLSSSDGESRGAVQMIQLESFIDEAARASRRSVATLTAAVTTATVGLLLVVTRYSVTRPIDDLAASFREVGAGDLSARVSIRRHDEIGRLAQEFNQMCERLALSQRALLEEQEERQRTEASLRRAERLASVGRLAAALAHEIGTPLNVIGGRAESLLRKTAGDDEVARHNLRIIVAQIDRMTRIVRGMLDFARARETHISPTRIDTVVARVLELVEIQVEKRRIHVEVDLARDLPLLAGDADQLHQVFLNLTTNALDAMPRGGTLTIRAHRSEPSSSTADGFLEVQVEDTGSGIQPAHLGRIFDPFFTTKDVGAGTGLGLSVAYGIVREHGGWIDVESEVDHGTRMSVHLPLAENTAMAPA
ncbi:MAG TPA: ATP-binding protein, partial [Candidatus Polarisedimenticolia bacterium]|nr:ATP-binding protein [Candidatus Polarisedimenticolia bacterium]